MLYLRDLWIKIQNETSLQMWLEMYSIPIWLFNCHCMIFIILFFMIINWRLDHSSNGLLLYSARDAQCYNFTSILWSAIWYTVCSSDWVTYLFEIKEIILFKTLHYLYTTLFSKHRLFKHKAFLKAHTFSRSIQL